MEPRVFISHSSKDKSIADAICNQLESAGIRCWIAPRNIEVGSDWTRGIMQGLAECQAFVLVFTAHANDSEHVGREVAKAFSLGSAVIPFRIEAVNPRENLGYFLETVQWLDATTSPWQKHLPLLAEQVQRLLAGDRSSTPNADVSCDRVRRSSSATSATFQGSGKSLPEFDGWAKSDNHNRALDGWFAGRGGGDSDGCLAFLLGESEH